MQGAKFVSWDINASGLCLVYDSCDLINDTSQSSTITSSVDCECRMPGLCRGPVYDRKLVNLERDCAQFCDGIPPCGYYSYLAEQKICLLFETCEVMEPFPNTISASNSADCKVDKEDTEEKLLLAMFYKKNSSTAFVNLVSLTEHTTSCQLLSFHHQNKVKYLGYVENMNAVVACVEDLPDCFTYDGVGWRPLTTQRKPSCSDYSFDDTFQAIPQGLVNVKGKSNPGREAWECEVDEIVSEIFTGQEWVELEIEDAKIAKLPFINARISKYRHRPQPVFWALDFEENAFWWSLDYEHRKWISIPQPVFDREGIDRSKIPNDFLYRGEGEGYLGFYKGEQQVYQSKEMTDTWTPIHGVFRPADADDHDHGRQFLTYDVVPKSFSDECFMY